MKCLVVTPENAFNTIENLIFQVGFDFKLIKYLKYTQSLLLKVYDFDPDSKF